MSQLKFFQFKKESFTLFMHFFSEDFEIEKRGCVTEIPEKFIEHRYNKKKIVKKYIANLFRAIKKYKNFFKKYFKK